MCIPPSDLMAGLAATPTADQKQMWNELAAYKERMDRARVRCLDIAGNEKVLGFEESYKTYLEMAYESTATYSWLNELRLAQNAVE